mgnify:CR=1 FL=1
MTHHRTTGRATRWSLGLLASTMLSGLPGLALAQAAAESSQLDEVVVTAQKRSENLQDVPISIQAIGNERLDALQVSDTTDYVRFMPSVTAPTGAPGFSNFYMRGVASGENNNHSGPLPSVGVYLDEQPVTTITGPLDVHIYDIARVEVLAGLPSVVLGFLGVLWALFSCLAVPIWPFCAESGLRRASSALL